MLLVLLHISRPCVPLLKKDLADRSSVSTTTGKPERGLTTVMCSINLKKSVVSSINLAPYYHGKVLPFCNSTGKSSLSGRPTNCAKREKAPTSSIPPSLPYELLFCFSTSVGLTVPQLPAEIQFGDQL